MSETLLGDRYLVQLSSDTRLFIVPDKAWYAEQTGDQMCAGCRRIDRSRHPAPCNVYVRQLPQVLSSGIVAWCCVGVIRLDLLDLLRPHLSEFALGGITLEEVGEVSNHHSLYSGNFVPLRGGRGSSYCPCQVCGRSGIFTTEPYVLREELPAGSVIQDDYCRLYLSSVLARNFPWTSFPDIRPRLVPILDQEKDDDERPIL
jgi:hypothetical protein